jgi:hypothetical protein
MGESRMEDWRHGEWERRRMEAESEMSGKVAVGIPLTPALSRLTFPYFGVDRP